MQIIAKYMIAKKGKSLTLEVQPKNSVEDVKSMIKEKTGLGTEQQCLVFDGKVLEDGHTLADYSVEDKGNIHVVLQTGGPCTACNPMMEIMVKTLTGRTISLRVRRFNTVGDVKIMIQEKEGFSPHHQHLVFDCNLLQDSRTLSGYNVQNGDVMLLLQQSGISCDVCNPNMEIFVKSLTGKTMALQVRRLNTVEDVKVMIMQKEGIPIDQQRLVFGSKALEDERTLAELSIQDRDTMHLLIRLGGPCNSCNPHMEIYVKPLTGMTVSLRVRRYNTIEDVKHMIQEKVPGFVPNLHRLTFNQTQLENGCSLSYYRIQDQDIIQLAK